MTFDYFVSGKDIPGIVYHNKSDRYPALIGTWKDMPIGNYDVKIEDYYRWNPAGDFHIDPIAHEIREYFADGSYEVVANSGI